MQRATEMALDHALGEIDRLLQGQWQANGNSKDQPPPLATDLRGAELAVSFPDRMVVAEGPELFDHRSIAFG